ncbi:transglycosylase SLT domain-containing protein [Streptomyces sp. GMY02]|uniref:transglycosylase SLT domain-containing protein n=1 Tax=Streptomyces sp. GMY02 TaxID=1333528 RepID=UPI001C2C87F1|nr:transglycosylase SLT domain-containing protein [Streptomyces sp. GMY02]QXE37548.1 transglycosylase SLT domain-containing protein [Streptomyces sp. GMY02]
MFSSRIADLRNLDTTTTRKATLAGVAAAGVAALTFSLVPTDASAAPVNASSGPVAAAAAKVSAQATTVKASTAKQQITAIKAAGTKAADKATYPDNLDGWIREALSIMKKNGIPGSYEGLHRNIMRESSGNPWAINLWDINAKNGIPSKGLLQVIPPTFKAYHVKGTPNNIYDPVANIVAAANYAADRYGSMDNVNSAY